MSAADQIVNFTQNRAVIHRDILAPNYGNPPISDGISLQDVHELEQLHVVERIHEN